MQIDLSVEDLAKIAGAAAAAYAAWTQVWEKRIRPRLRKRRHHHEIELNSQRFNRTQVALQQWHAQHGSMRVLALVASNCGSSWEAHKELKISVVAEAQKDHVPRVFKRFHRWDADPPYRQLLSDVIASKDRGYLLVTSDMAHSELRDYYEDQGVVASVVFAITITEDAELIYVSLNFGDPQKDAELLAKQLGRAKDLHAHAEQVRKMAVLGRDIWE